MDTLRVTKLFVFQNIPCLIQSSALFLKLILFFRHTIPWLCLKLKWVMLTDTDEFILPYDQELEPGIVRRALKQRQQEKQGEECINLPRYQFGVRDLKSPLEPLPGINISLTNVVTERFQYREQAPMQLDSNMTLSAGKNLVNVQLLRSFPVDPSISVHQVLPECPPSYDDQDDPVALVYHYSGSKEQFNFRRDPRGLKFRIKYEERQKFIKVHDPTISSWISKFADYMGKEEATHLLQDVGEPTKAGRYPFYMCGCPNTCDVDAMEKKSPKDDTVSCRIRVKYLVEKYKSSVEAACIKAVEETDSACGYECHPRFCTEPTGSFDSGKQTKLQSNIESVGRKKRSDQRKSAENSTFDYYLHGKIKYLSIPFDDEKTYKALFDEKSEIVPQDLETTWALSNELLHPTRNHDSVIVEQEGKQLLVNVLGRHNRHVEVIDLLTGKQWDHLTEGSDPEGFPLNDLNHICTVLVDSVKEEGKKELWMPCGFKGDKVNREESVQYARILDLETLKLRVGPKLPYSGGACVAQALEIIPNEPPMVCTFGGTVDRHDSGKFLPYSSCYDRVREKWWFPFGKLPFGFDHGSTAFVPADACRPNDPSRVIILNFRTVSYGTQRSEMLAYDLPREGWKVKDLEELSMEDPGSWYIYTNVSYTGPEDIANCPRDASGAIMANGGREILNFGGIFYDFPNGKFRSTRFSTIRSFDVCKKQWRVVGDLGAQIFALQTSASNNLQLSVTCGGEARHPSFKKTMNSPWCLVHRFGSGISVQNRHGTPATSDFADDFFPGSRHAIDLSLSR